MRNRQFTSTDLSLTMPVTKFMNSTLPLKAMAFLISLTLIGFSTVSAQDDFFKSFDLPRKASSSGKASGGPKGKGAVPDEVEPPPAVQERAGEVLTSGEAHPSLELENYPPLISKDEYDGFRRKRSEFRQLISEGTTDDASREKVNAGLKILLHGLTLEELQDSVAANEALKNVFRYVVFNAGSKINQSASRRLYREELFDSMMPLLKELLQHNYYVRLRATIILGNMDLVPGKLREGVEPEPYRPAAELCLELISSDDQPEAVKIKAARCVEKSLKYGELRSSTRKNAALVCIDQLLNDSQTWWYKNVLIDCLVATELEINENKPFIVEALAKVLSDPTQHKMSRSHAAYALGRVPMNSQMQLNLHLISFEIMSLAVSMANDRNNLIRTYQGAPPEQFMSEWGICFQGTYLAYQPTNQLEKNLGMGLLQRVTKPGMGNDSAVITGSYALISQFYAHCMRLENIKSPFPEAMITAGREWLDEYPPGDFRVSPQSEPLIGVSEPQEKANSEVTAR